MNELIRINNEDKVEGRDLYEFLQVGTDYTKWFERMCEYGFVENIDFWTSVENVRRQDGTIMPIQRTNHLMTISMAKEISMLQRNEKGKQARLYFIKCEEEHKHQKQLTPLEMLAAQANAMVEQERRQKAIEAEQKKQSALLNTQSEKLDALEDKQDLLTTRLNNLSGINIKGTPRQVLNKMIQAYAYQQGKTIGKAWSDFYSAFHIAFGIRLKIRWSNYVNKNGLTKKKYKLLDYLEEHNYINDAINVVDKMLNK